MHLSLTQQQTWLLGQRALQGTLGRPQGLGRLTHLPSTSWQKRSLYVNKNGRHFISWKNIQTVVLFANLDPRAFFWNWEGGKRPWHRLLDFHLLIAFLKHSSEKIIMRYDQLSATYSSFWHMVDFDIYTFCPSLRNNQCSSEWIVASMVRFKLQ